MLPGAPYWSAKICNFVFLYCTTGQARLEFYTICTLALSAYIGQHHAEWINVGILFRSRFDSLTAIRLDNAIFCGLKQFSSECSTVLIKFWNILNVNTGCIWKPSRNRWVGYEVHIARASVSMIGFYASEVLFARSLSFLSLFRSVVFYVS